MASMVVIAWPTAALTGVTHDRLGMPSRCTVQAPQSATPQPNFVPFMPSRSRRTHSSGMSSGASTVCDLPLIFSLTTRHPTTFLETAWSLASLDPFADVGRTMEQLDALPLACQQKAEDVHAHNGDLLEIEGGAWTAELQLPGNLSEVLGLRGSDHPDD